MAEAAHSGSQDAHAGGLSEKWRTIRKGAARRSGLHGWFSGKKPPPRRDEKPDDDALGAERAQDALYLVPLNTK